MLAALRSCYLGSDWEVNASCEPRTDRHSGDGCSWATCFIRAEAPFATQAADDQSLLQMRLTVAISGAMVCIGVCVLAHCTYRMRIPAARNEAASSAAAPSATCDVCTPPEPRPS